MLFFHLVNHSDQNNQETCFRNSSLSSLSRLLKFLEIKLTFNPHDSGILHWLFLLSMIYLYNVAFVTFRLVFPYIQERYWYYFLLLDVFADIYYVLDLVVQLRTGFLHQGYLISTISSLSKQYILVDKAILFDVISVLPLDYLLLINSHISPYYNIIIGLRVLRFLKYYRIRHFFSRLEARSDNPSIIEIISLFVTLLNWIHIVACLYFGLSFLIGFENDNWVYPGYSDIFINTLGHINLAFGDVWQQYFHSLHWGTQIVTTIGEVPSPITDLEHCIVIMLLLCGIYLYATLIGEVGNTIQTLNVNRTRFTTRLDNIKQYMSKFLIESNLQYMVVKLFDHQWITKKGVDELEILENLPKKLRAQIAFSANRHLLEKNFLFSKQPLSYQIELILHMKTQILLPEEYIYKEGHVGNDMYIIREGRVQLTKSNNLNNCGECFEFRELTKGDFFGESCVINFDFIGRRREETAISKGFCSIWVLEKRILLEVLLDYPNVMDFLRSEFHNCYFLPQVDKGKIIKSGLYTLDELHLQMNTIDQYRREILFHFQKIQEEQIFIDYIIGKV